MSDYNFEIPRTSDDGFLNTLNSKRNPLLNKNISLTNFDPKVSSMKSRILAVQNIATTVKNPNESEILDYIQKKPNYANSFINTTAFNSTETKQINNFNYSSSPNAYSPTADVNFSNALRQLQSRLKEIQNLSNPKISTASTQSTKNAIYGSYFNSSETMSNVFKSLNREPQCFIKTEKKNGFKGNHNNGYSESSTWSQLASSYERQIPANRIKRRSGDYGNAKSIEKLPSTRFQHNHYKTDSIDASSDMHCYAEVAQLPSIPTNFSMVNSKFTHKCKKPGNSPPCKIKPNTSNKDYHDYTQSCSNKSYNSQLNQTQPSPHVINRSYRSLNSSDVDNDHVEMLSKSKQCNLSFPVNSNIMSCNQLINNTNESKKNYRNQLIMNMNKSKNDSIRSSSFDTDYCQINSYSNYLSDLDSMGKLNSPISTCCSTNASCSRPVQIHNALTQKPAPQSSIDSQSTIYCKSHNNNENKIKNPYFSSSFINYDQQAQINPSIQNNVKSTYRNIPQNYENVCLNPKIPSSFEKVSYIPTPNIPPCKNPACLCSLEMKLQKSELINKIPELTSINMAIPVYEDNNFSKNSSMPQNMVNNCYNNDYAKPDLHESSSDPLNVLKKRAYDKINPSEYQIIEYVNNNSSNKKSKVSFGSDINWAQVFVWCVLSFIFIASVIGAIILLAKYLKYSPTAIPFTKEVDTEIINNFPDDQFMFKSNPTYRVL